MVRIFLRDNNYQETKEYEQVEEIFYYDHITVVNINSNKSHTFPNHRIWYVEDERVERIGF